MNAAGILAPAQHAARSVVPAAVPVHLLVGAAVILMLIVLGVVAAVSRRSRPQWARGEDGEAGSRP